MIQYPKLIHTTLPSVESWGSDMNILRDPPKALFTRKIDKVSDTSLITEMIDASGDRVCESISLYARGVNPMVSVSYDNNGNNAGIKGNPTQYSAKPQAYMPHRVNREGAFRPPIQGPRDLLPLSRLPRINTTIPSAPQFADYSKKWECPNPDNMREVKASILNTASRPNAVYNIEMPIYEGFEFTVDNAINNNKILVSADSGVRTLDYTITYNSEVDKGIKDPLKGGYSTNLSSKNNVTNLEDQVSYKMPIKDGNISVSHTPSIRGMDVNGEFGNEKGYEMDKRVPNYSATTNIGDIRIHKNINPENTIELDRITPLASFSINPGQIHNPNNMNTNSRNIHLHKNINYGGFENQGLRPTSERVQNFKNNIITDKNTLSKKAFSQYQERYNEFN